MIDIIPINSTFWIAQRSASWPMASHRDGQRHSAPAACRRPADREPARGGNAQDRWASIAAELRAGTRDDEVDPAAILDRRLGATGERDPRAELDDAAGMVAADAAARRAQASAPGGSAVPRWRSQVRAPAGRGATRQGRRCRRCRGRRPCRASVDQQVGRAAPSTSKAHRRRALARASASAAATERQPQPAEGQHGQGRPGHCWTSIEAPGSAARRGRSTARPPRPRP